MAEITQLCKSPFVIISHQLHFFQERSVLPFFAQGFTLGFAAAVQPGPFLAYLISLVINLGWRQMLPAIFAPLVSDGPIILIVTLILSQVPPLFRNGLSIAGGIFILYLAFNAYLQWRQKSNPLGEIRELQSPSSRKALLQAALMNILGPGPYLFWSLVGGPILLAGWNEAPLLGFSFLFGFYTAMIASLFTIILLFGTARNLGERTSRILLGISILVLAGYGGIQLLKGFSGSY